MNQKIPRASFFYPMDNCDASWELSLASGEEPPTVYADKGTRGHAAIAGRIPQSDLSADEIKDVETIGRKYKARLEDWLAGDKVTEILTEEEFAYRLRLKPVFTGHPDKVVFAGPQRAFIPDFKFSWQPLDAMTATNRQLMAYVALASQRFPKLREIRTAIIPLSNKLNPPADYDDHDISLAKDWAESVVARATAAGEKKPNAGPWCQYCSGKVLCPIWQRQIPELAAASPELQDGITDEALAQIAPRLKIAAKVIERLLDRLEQRVREAPEKFPGWSFQQGETRRSISAPAKAWKAVRERLSPDEFIAACSLSIIKLEEAYYHRFKGTRKESDAALGELLAGLIQYKRTKSSLVYDPKPTELLAGETAPADQLPLPDSEPVPAPAA